MGCRRFRYATNSAQVSTRTRVDTLPFIGTALAIAYIAVPADITFAQIEMAEVGTEGLYLETTPQNLPGHQKGAREATGEQEPLIQPPTDNIRSWWNWDYGTGNWNGFRTDLKKQGFDFQGSYALDWTSVLDGGISTEASTERLLDFNFTFDLNHLIGLEGGSFFVDFHSISGSGTSGHVGDFQGISNIETDRNIDTFAEVWYEQWLMDDFIRIKIGKVDANSEFGFVETAGDFINSSPGVSPTIFTIPTYPESATGINLFLYPKENWYLGFGFYDGANAVDGVHTGTRGPKSFFDNDLSDDYFLIAETGLQYENFGHFGPGRLAFGAWHHTGKFTTFSGGTDDGTEGIYAIVEQQLWMADPDNPDGPILSGFAQYGYADDKVSEVGQHIGGGLVLDAPLASRRNDVLGAMVSFVNLSDETSAGFAEDETTFEIFYRLQLTSFASIKPDIQYIKNPNGDPTIDDAIVGTLRFEIAF